MYFVGINVRAQVAIILLACGPCVVIVNYWDRFCTLGRAPRTKETLPDFHECRGLTGYQRTLRFWGIAESVANVNFYSPM